MSKKWIYNETADGIWAGEEYSNRKKAIKAGRKTAQEEGWGSLFIAYKEAVIPTIDIDASEVIVNTAENLDANYGSELDFGDAFINSINDEQEELLQQMLDSTAEQWLKKINYKSSMFICAGTEEIAINKEEAE